MTPDAGRSPIIQNRNHTQFVVSRFSLAACVVRGEGLARASAMFNCCRGETDILEANHPNLQRKQNAGNHPNSQQNQTAEKQTDPASPPINVSAKQTVKSQRPGSQPESGAAAPYMLNRMESTCEFEGDEFFTAPEIPDSYEIKKSDPVIAAESADADSGAGGKAAFVYPPGDDHPEGQGLDEEEERVLAEMKKISSKCAAGITGG